MILYLLHRDLPSPNRVALFATGAELAFVNIGMTISTFHAHVAEYRLDVTRGAGDLFMQAAQREAGLAVVKLRDAADGFPATERVAILAGDVQGTMRATSVGVGLRRVADRTDRQQRRHDRCE